MRVLSQIAFTVLVGCLISFSNVAYSTAVIDMTEEMEYIDSASSIGAMEPADEHYATSPVALPMYANGYAEGQIQQIELMIRRFNPKLNPVLVQHVARIIDQQSRQFKVDPKLLVSVVAVESSFNPRAVSRTGAIGLGQLKPKTARWLGVRNPYDPKQNVYGVAKYLRYLLNRYNGSIRHSLAAYFQGQGTIDRRGIDSRAEYYIGKVHRVFVQL